MLQNLFRHRNYLFGSLWVDFRYRYAGTVLGFFWFFINPILDAAIYTIVFSQILIFRSGGLRGIDYTIFLLAGIFPWLTLSQIINRGSNTLNTQSSFLRRLAISPDIFIAKDSLIHLTSLFIYMIVLLVLIFFLGYSISFRYLLVIPVTLLFCSFGFGIALITAPIRVLFPDMGEILGVLLQIWRWTLPISFPFDIFPSKLQAILVYNPPFYFIKAFRDIILENSFPTATSWTHMIVWTAIFLIIGSEVSRRLEYVIKDYL